MDSRWNRSRDDRRRGLSGILRAEQAAGRDVARRGRPGRAAAPAGQGRARRDARPAGLGRPGRLRRGGDPADRVRPADAQDLPDGRPPGGAERHARRRRAGRRRGRVRAVPIEARGPARPWRRRSGESTRVPPEYLGPEGRGPARLRPGPGRPGGRPGPAAGRGSTGSTCSRYDWPRLELEIDCGGGTYIRSIARDVGEALGCGGLVEVLVRTRIGPFTLERGGRPGDPLGRDDRRACSGPPLEAVADLPRLVLSAEPGRRRSPGPAARARAELAALGPRRARSP